MNRALTVVVTVALAAGLALVWVRVVQTLTEPSNGPKTIGRPGALVWDGRVFTSAAQLKTYLESQGKSYSRWAARHPTAFGATPPAVKHTKTTKATKPAPHRVSSPSVSPTSSRSGTSMLLLVLFLIGGLILGGSALLPARYAPDALQRFYDQQDRRMVALAASAAVLIGFAVAFYLFG